MAESQNKMNTKSEKICPECNGSKREFWAQDPEPCHKCHGRGTLKYTEVINKSVESGGIYIGRGSIFGNPYVMGKDGNREEVVNRYRDWFRLSLKDKIFKKEILKLKGQKISCFCAPLSCHGDVIKEYLDNLD